MMNNNYNKCILTYVHDNYGREPDTPVPIATITEHKGEKRDLTLLRGYNTDLVEQLIEKSKQPHITNPLACPRDAGSRFVSPEAFDTWLHKGGGRSPYFLTCDDSDLAGIVWFGAESAPESIAQDPATDPNYTFAIRIYDGYKGKGIGRDFIIESLRDYVKLLHETNRLQMLNGIHLETNVANAGAEHLYNAIGWREVYRTDGNEANPVNNRIAMVLTPEVIADILS